MQGVPQTRNHRFVVLPSSVKLIDGRLVDGRFVDGRLVDGWLVDGRSVDCFGDSRSMVSQWSVDSRLMVS